MLTVTKDVEITEEHAWEKVTVENGTLTMKASCHAKTVIINNGKLAVETGYLHVVEELPTIPIQGAKVQVFDYNTGQLVEEKYTDENGKAVFTLPAGTYRVVVTKSNYEQHEQIVELTEDKQKPVELEYTPDPPG